MVNTRSDALGLGNSMSDDEIRELVATEVSYAIADTITEIITTIKDELLVMLNEKIAAIPTIGDGQSRRRGFQ